MERLYKKLESYSKSDFYPFHMPGHKRNPNCIEGNFPFTQDITEIHGFDNLHHAEDLLLQAQQAVARVYGTRESFYSVNGSTAGLLAAISAAVAKGGKILVARNCHKAVYHAMYLRDLIPVYLYPQFEENCGLNGGILPSDVEKSLQEVEGIQAVLITSPTYDGMVSDVKKIAEIAHRYQIPLIVDEAHGAHFHFSEYFPVSAAELGADLVIQSFHKTLPSMTQTAVIHRCSDRVDREKLMRFLGIYQTSSPSYIMMANMDACMAKLEKDGIEMFSVYTRLLDRARTILKKCSRLKLITEEIVGRAGIYDFDPSKILISTVNTGISGRELSQILREKYHLEMEMDAEHYVTALTAVGDTEEGFERLCRALLEIDHNLEKISEVHFTNPCLPLTQVHSISYAMDAAQEVVALEESRGRISAEFAYFYPPGIPVIVPGERITGHFLQNMRRLLAQGFVLQGLKDYTNQTISVLKE